MCMAYIHANLILDQEYSSILFRDTCLAYKVKVTYKWGQVFLGTL